MLVNFSVQNFKSFKAKQSLSLVTNSKESLLKGASSKTGNSVAPQISHALAIFGANGAGKSNIIEAMDLMLFIIHNSATKITKGDKLPFFPFRLSAECLEKPTEFEIVFSHDNSIFQYGFSFDREKIHEEWLYENPAEAGTRNRHWFYREYDNKKHEYNWYTNNSYIKRAEKLKEGTRDNSLFLASAVRDNSESLNRPFSWLQSNIHTVTANEKFTHEFTSKQVAEGIWKSEILDFLSHSDFRIDDISVLEEPANLPSEHLEKFSSEFRQLITEKAKDAKQYTPTFKRTTDSGNTVDFELHEESTGTQVMYSLVGPLLDVLKEGSTLIVDELHNNLHPHLMQQILNVFRDTKVNKKGAQLIFSSHDSFVMRETLFEEQIWFAEKQADGQTELFSLIDIEKTRTTDFSKSYLGGRYGAVPRIGS